MSGYPIPSDSTRRLVIDPLLPSAKVGCVTGGAGLLVGGITGILISKHPHLFSTAAGIQWFGLGTSFWYFRSVLSQADSNGKSTHAQELKYSTLAGSLSGAVNGAFRSRANILPGAIMMGILGLTGQGVYNSFLHSGDPEKAPRPSFIQRLTESKWAPLRSLSDDEYEKMLGEKWLKLEVEISLLDGKIASLRALQAGESSGEVKDV